jgi:hypothetical protein
MCRNDDAPTFYCRYARAVERAENEAVTVPAAGSADGMVRAAVLALHGRVFVDTTWGLQWVARLHF